VSEETTKEKTPVPVKASSSGQLVGTTLDEQWRLAVAFYESGMLPKAYKSPQQVLVGMQYAYELGLKPLMALRQIAVINGQPSLWGELPLGLVRRSGLLEYFREWHVDKDYKEISFENKNLDVQVFAALCEVQRKGGEKRTYSFTQKDKHGLGVSAIWNSFEKVMMMRKARALALKAQFPDVLEGMPIAEYDHHVYIDQEGFEGEVLTPKEKKLENFKNKFNRETVVETEAVQEGETNVPE
jgi:hypothetical protein